MNWADWPLLSVITFLPALGGSFFLFTRGEEALVARNARYFSLFVSLVTFLLSLLLWSEFDSGTADFQFVEDFAWIGENIRYHMGVDGISVLFIVLTAFLTPLCILASWTSVQDRVKEYMMAFLIMESLMIGVFSSLDLFMFYLFFEGGLIPMFLIIGVWGGPRKIYASFKFFLYTLLGSVLMLLAILYMYNQAGTTDIPALMNYRFDPDVQIWLWLAFFASFAVKLPMWPVHTWLPDAHVEAPTAGSVILAGIMLKMGGYGFLRFSIPMFPHASDVLAPLIFGLSIMAVIYTSLVALAQQDMKKLIAYSSVAHMGFVTIGIFTLNQQGLEGGIFQMLSHGVVSAALFLIVGVVYDRMHSREIATYGGLVHRMPQYAFFFMVFMLASVGLPGTSGFIGEFLVLIGAYQVSSLLAFLAATGVILGAAYMLWLYRRVMFGQLLKDSLKTITDLSGREIAIFTPLLLAIIWMGIYPMPILDVLHESVQHLISQHAAVTADGGSAALIAGGGR